MLQVTLLQIERGNGGKIRVRRTVARPNGSVSVAVQDAPSHRQRLAIFQYYTTLAHRALSPSFSSPGAPPLKGVEQPVEGR